MAGKYVGIDFMDVVGSGWEILKKNFLQIILVSILAIAVNIMGSIVAGAMSALGPVTAIIGFLANLALGFVVSAGVMVIFFKIAQEQEFKYTDIFADGNLTLKYTLTSIAYGLIVLVGLILLIVPGLILGYKYRFAVLAVIDKNIGVSEALKLSDEITKGKKMSLFILDLIIMVAIIIGLVLLIIPGVIIMISAYLGYILLYKSMIQSTYGCDDEEELNGAEEVTAEA